MGLRTLAAIVALGDMIVAPPKPPLEKQLGVDALAGAALLMPIPTGMVRYAASVFVMGSPTDMLGELYAAKALCETEPLGFLCVPHRCRDGKQDKSDACISNAFMHETPARTVTLGAFELDRTEVTVASYRRCVTAGGCTPAGFPAGDARFDRDDLPVTHVTHHDAVRYCAFRGARLPTEAEFERAARGIAGRRFPWGKLPNPKNGNHGSLDWESAFWVEPPVFPGGPNGPLEEWRNGIPDPADGFLFLAPVGSFPEGTTPEGVHDLAGNVAEWVGDWWEQLYGLHTLATKSPVGPTELHGLPRVATDPKGPPNGNFRVVRGGGYRSPMVSLRGAFRARWLPGERAPDLGFRCAKDAP